AVASSAAQLTQYRSLTPDADEKSPRESNFSGASPMTRNGTKSSGAQEDGRSGHRADHRSLHRGPIAFLDRDCSNQPTNSACAESLLSGKYRSEDKFRCRSSTRARSWIAAVAENVVVELKAVDH